MHDCVYGVSVGRAYVQLGGTVNREKLNYTLCKKLHRITKIMLKVTQAWLT